MIPAERRASVLEVVRQRRAVSIQELSEVIGTSPSTVRRDLEYLSGHGYLERTYGGANVITPSSTIYEQPVPAKVMRTQKEKVAIGELAASLIDDRCSVLFDSSSTVLAAAKAVVKRGLSVRCITNDLEIAGHLAHAPTPGAELIVVGGTCRRGSYTLLGEPGLQLMERLNVDVGLIGIHAFGDGRLSDTSLEVAAMKRWMIRSCRRVIVLADSMKFSTVAFCDICSLSEIDEVVTDEGLNQERRTFLREHGARVHIASTVDGVYGDEGRSP